MVRTRVVRMTDRVDGAGLYSPQGVGLAIVQHLSLLEEGRKGVTGMRKRDGKGEVADARQKSQWRQGQGLAASPRARTRAAQAATSTWVHPGNYRIALTAASTPDRQRRGRPGILSTAQSAGGAQFARSFPPGEAIDDTEGAGGRVVAAHIRPRPPDGRMFLGGRSD